MPRNEAFDSGELRSLAISYNRNIPDLSPEIALVDGSKNMVVTKFGNLSKRPGTPQFDTSLLDSSLSGTVDHFIIAESLSSSNTPPLKWLIFSVTNASTSLHEIWIKRIDITPGVLEGPVGASVTPWEMTTSRGYAYFKGVPQSASSLTDPIYAFQFNCLTGFFSKWGILPPTVPAAVSASGISSTYNFTVNFGWYYTYTWKSITGHESNRAPLQTNPSLASSSTGPISNIIPRIQVTGNSDTGYITSIVIYRSTDGGGNFYFLDEITNTGSGSIQYDDRNFNDGTSTPAQPYPDTALDTTRVAPSLTLNSPPPTVAAGSMTFSALNTTINNSTTTVIMNDTFNGFSVSPPSTPFTITLDNEPMLVSASVHGSGIYTFTVTRGVNGAQKLAHTAGAIGKLTPIVGFDLPQQCSPMATYAGRIWYGIGNILFYSGQEEIGQGVPEEAFPSGLQGNYYRLNHPIVNVFATSEALYVICTEEVLWLRGSTRDTFQIINLFTDIGGRQGHPRAICAADKSIVFLTYDYRLCIARGYKRDFLSDKLGSDIKNSIITNGGSIFLRRHAELEKDWLIVASATPTLSNCQQWIYDFNAGDGGLWNVPWTLQATAVCSGVTASNTNLLWAVSGSSTNNNVVYTDFSFTSTQDYIPGTGLTNYTPQFTINLLRNPTGNHVNQLREPGMVSILHAIKMDRTKFVSDTDPSLVYFIDNSTASGGTLNTSPEQPPRRVQSTGYVTLWYMIDTVGERVSATFFKTASPERFEVQNIAFIWNPDSGA